MTKQAQIFLTVLAGWMNRKQQHVIEYLLAENKVLKEQFKKTGKKLDLTDAQRREIARHGKKIGWKQLQQYANLVTPQTILDWHRRLIALKYTPRSKPNTEKQKRSAEIRKLAYSICRRKPRLGLRTYPRRFS